MSVYEACFSADYFAARERFREAADKAGAAINSYSPTSSANSSVEDSKLFVDVAAMGEGDNLVVVSSGLHGIEGFLGSAIQLALLQQWRERPAPCRVVLIHAINPWGFRHLRRVDENNIDLNRNFPTGDYRGAPEGYHQLHTLLNPDHARCGHDFFALRAIAKIARHGMAALKVAVASGQYEYPRGLFYGGAAVSPSTQLFIDHVGEWIGTSRHVFHVDVHTGLGKYAQCKLLIPRSDDGGTQNWCRRYFEHSMIETHGDQAATAYPVNGMLGDWLLSEFNDRTYHFVGAEVGTYSPVSVLQSLRDENRHHFFGEPHSAKFARSKQRLLQSFCPQDSAWRCQSVANVLAVVEQASQALSCKSE